MRIVTLIRNPLGTWVIMAYHDFRLELLFFLLSLRTTKLVNTQLVLVVKSTPFGEVFTGACLCTSSRISDLLHSIPMDNRSC